MLSSNVIVFFYSFWMMVADAFRMSGRCDEPSSEPGEPRLRSPHARPRRRWKTDEVSRAVMPPLVLTLDFLLVFLQFGASVSPRNASSARLDAASQAPPPRWPGCAAAFPTCSWSTTAAPAMCFAASWWRAR